MPLPVPAPDHVPLQRTTRSNNTPRTPSSYSILSTAIPHGTAYTPAELESAAAAAKADDTVDDPLDEYGHDDTCNHPYYSRTWWPLSLLQRRRYNDKYSALPQSIPLLGEDEKPLRYVRAAWGRVGNRRRLTAVFTARNVFRMVGALLGLALLSLIGLGINMRLVRPPPYQLVPWQEYTTVLSNFVKEHNLTALTPTTEGAGTDHTISEQLLHLQDRMHNRALSARCAGTQHTILFPDSVPEDQPRSQIPSTMYSSDRVELNASEAAIWRASWEQRGFDPATFLTDAAADQFVNQDFGPSRLKPVPSSTSTLTKLQTAVQKAWYALPRGVLRADFMRYLLLLSRGGTWSDMDVEPMGNLSTWNVTKLRWMPLPRASPSSINVADPTCASLLTNQGTFRLPPAEPVRLVVGLECEPWQYMQHSDRAWMEWARLVAMPRHREFQFTQWTLHGAPGHPVLIDVLRRLLNNDELFDQYQAAHQPFKRDATHPWTDIDAARKWILSDPTPPFMGSTEEDDPSWLRWKIWPWAWAWPRWGWHPLSVEEWTGPALWTDAVFTYLNVVAGLTPSDLYGLSQPVQVADVIVAPNSWFAPPRDALEEAKVLHNFRGSWKHGADVVPDQQPAE